jgi:hypothetical protein
MGKGLANLGIVLSLVALWPAANVSGQSTLVATRPTPVRFVDNFTQQFAVPPDFLWAELKRMYLEGNKYRALGFNFEKVLPTLDAPLGGTEVWRDDNGIVDRRTAYFTAIDDSRRFLALRVIYSEGLSAQVSYEVRPAPGGGSLVQLIVHAQQAMPATDKEPAPEMMRNEAQRLTRFHYGELKAMWDAEARRIEALYRAAARSR